MRKRVSIGIILFVIISAFMLKCGQTVSHIIANDEVIEWQCYGDEEQS